MPERKMQKTVIDLKEYRASQQRDLAAYRKLGTVAHLKRLRRQEIRREQLYKQLKTLTLLVLCVGSLLFHIWIFSSFIDVVLQKFNFNSAYQFWNFFNLLY